ncbi:MAG TPA: hypothetical protein VF524_01055 [Polyangia bacterium]
MRADRDRLLDILEAIAAIQEQAQTVGLDLHSTRVYWTSRDTYDNSGTLTGCSGAVMKLCPK